MYTGYCKLRNNCKFDRPLQNAWIIQGDKFDRPLQNAWIIQGDKFDRPLQNACIIQGPFFINTQLRKRNLKKGAQNRFATGGQICNYFASRCMYV